MICLQVTVVTRDELGRRTAPHGQARRREDRRSDRLTTDQVSRHASLHGLPGPVRLAAERHLEETRSMSVCLRPSVPCLVPPKSILGPTHSASRSTVVRDRG